MLRPDARYADLIVVCTARGLFGYRNRCPHTGAPMEWEPDRFLDISGTLIQCGIHGALFRIEDGYCLSGPCARQSLQAVALIARRCSCSKPGTPTSTSRGSPRARIATPL